MRYVRGILGLASYSLLLNYSGDAVRGAAYMRSARGFAAQWLQMALDDSGDHYRLQFNLNNTWSTKYNLMWQGVLGLDLFPQSVADMEVKWYLSHAQPFGVPLDSRSAMVKCDWLSWAAAFASSSQDAQRLLDFVYAFADQSPSRSPFSDWYNSTTNRMIGFTARPVMGGLYARTLIHEIQQQHEAEQLPEHAQQDARAAPRNRHAILDSLRHNRRS